jgi:uncharacterized membrane protein
MNPAHLHLLITHLPIYGAFLGAVVLCFGILTRSSTTCNAAYVVLLIAAIGGVVAYFTGEPAEETIENISVISKDLIEEHEESAVATIILAGIMGVSSIAGLYIASKSLKFIKSLPILVLIASIACFIAAARTGYLGGRIRHSEVDNSVKVVYEDKRD